jgi:lipopolysaccharide/colanic/teichoic acid biosynthesis glycosyltransferase
MIKSVRIAKRLLDIAGSAAGIVGAAPVMGAIALAVKVTSPGPVFYKQRRAGRFMGEDGAEDSFEVYKFRTMVQDAEAKTGAVLAKPGADSRVTSIGGFLRKTRLDELPQFFNVFKGEMSIVGPRPERPELIQNLSAAIPFFEERMRLLKPGITGLAQISLSYSGQLQEGSNLAQLKATLINPFEIENADDSQADDMRTKMLYDFAYSVAMEDFWEFLRMDLEIIFKTPLVMFWKRSG